ncbi:hypothetical protein Droror1_Dr00002227 [Drosera rotundifolia]
MGIRREERMDEMRGEKETRFRKSLEEFLKLPRTRLKLGEGKRNHGLSNMVWAGQACWASNGGIGSCHAFWAGQGRNLGQQAVCLGLD